ncbi:MAG TPA: rod-binding protein [Paracoccaceae bacterium]|nr:rod-binding protein [Paracoccaceae bacterium]HMO72938.1 rod-binding protein [Paracoccaceae bacterium]
MLPTLPASLSLPAATDRTAQLRARAAELETAFLAEMLGHAGLGTPATAFGGGTGEEQFASFLRQAQAGAMVRAGGIGLTEVFVRALAARSDEL